MIVSSIFDDTYGHLVGDKVLRFIGTTLKKTIKGKNFAARLGGEEFGVILPQTELISTMAVADQIRKEVSANRLVDEGNGEKYGVLTVSIGVEELSVNETAGNCVCRWRANYRY